MVLLVKCIILTDHSYERSVIDVTKLLVKNKNDDDFEKYITLVKDRPFNDKRYLISNDKLKELGWVQNVSSNEGIDLLLKYNDDTQIILFKPTEEDLNWNLFYENLKKNINFNITVYSNNKEYSEFTFELLNINDLFNYILNNNDYKNFLIINDYKNFKINGLQKKITGFDNMILKNYILNSFNDNNILDIDFKEDCINTLININNLKIF